MLTKVKGSVIDLAVASISDLAAITPTDTDKAVVVTDENRGGTFVWRAGDYSAEVTADTQQGIWVKANSVAASAGAWQRQYDGAVSVKWFGAVGDGVTDDTAAIQSSFNYVKDNPIDLYFSSGTYLIGSTVSITSPGGGVEAYRNIKVICAQEAKFKGETTSVNLFDISGQRRFTWDGGWFSKGGNCFQQIDATSTAPVAETYFNNIKFAPSESDQITRCYKADTSIGVYFNNCQFGSDLADDAIEIAVQLTGSSSEQTNINVFKNCAFIKIKTGGFLLDTTSYNRCVVEFDACRFEAINGYALQANNVVRNLVFRDCYFEALGTASIEPVIVTNGARIAFDGGFIAGVQNNPSAFINCSNGGEVTTYGSVEFVSDGIRQFLSLNSPLGVNNLFGVNIFGTGSESYETLLFGGSSSFHQYVNYSNPRLTSTLSDLARKEVVLANTDHNGFIRHQTQSVLIAAQGTDYPMATINVPNPGHAINFQVDINQSIGGVGASARQSSWLATWNGSNWVFTASGDTQAGNPSWLITPVSVDVNTIRIDLQRTSGGATATAAQVAIMAVQASGSRIGNEVTIAG